MMHSVVAAVALTIAPVPALTVEPWGQASQYDTLSSLLPFVRAPSPFAREPLTFVTADSPGKAIANPFEPGSSSGFDLSRLIDISEGDWSSVQLVRELRQLSGLTWQQAANLVGVQPRSLHNWAAGHVIAEKNLRRLGELLAVLRHIDRGYAEANRDLLLNTSVEGRTLFALLEAGEFERVKEQAGRGVGRAGPTAAHPQAAPNIWGPEHFGMALSASLDDPDEEIVPIPSTGKRPANARRRA
jgi:hypothetical protein